MKDTVPVMDGQCLLLPEAKSAPLVDTGVGSLLREDIFLVTLSWGGGGGGGPLEPLGQKTFFH